MPEETWIIILAGGEGTRLAPLTRALYGSDVPKQFAVLDGTSSMLQQTIERAAAIGDPTRTLVVVSAQRAALAAQQLLPYPGVRLLVQPGNLDTGPGLLLPISYVRARSPSARIVVLPADHHVPNPEPLVGALTRAAAQRETSGRITLVGVVADRAETEYGWILPGARLARRDRHPSWAVREFVEKPIEAVAQRLLGLGALWNTFIATGPVSAFWEMARSRLPHHVDGFGRWAAQSDLPGCADRLGALYQRLAPASWSQHVVAQTAPRELAVVSIAGSGWSDWGSPRRVFESLAGTPALDRLLARVSTPERPSWCVASAEPS